MKKFFGKMFLSLFSLFALLVPTFAHAALTAPTIDLADFYTIVGVVLVAVAAIWATMQGVKLLRSK